MSDVQQPFNLDGQHESSMDNTLTAELDNAKRKKRVSKKRRDKKKKGTEGDAGNGVGEHHTESDTMAGVFAVGEEMHELDQVQSELVDEHSEVEGQFAGGPVLAVKTKKRKKNKKAKNDDAGDSAMNGQGENHAMGKPDMVNGHSINGHSKPQDQLAVRGPVLAYPPKSTNGRANSTSPAKPPASAFLDTSDNIPDRAPPNRHSPSPIRAQSTEASDSKTTTPLDARHTPNNWTDPAALDDEWDLSAAREPGLGPFPRAPTQHDPIATWFRAQTSPYYHALSVRLQDRAIEHIKHYHSPTSARDADWPKQLRHMVWRAVVRANFFWTNPHTGKHSAKPQPVARPTGVFENHFEAFVECAAERLDRIGRDLPDAEYVKTVEDEVRDFLGRVEDAGKGKELEHLAFLLLFDEEQRKAPLSLQEMQDRIRRSLGGSDIVWKGLDVMKRGKPWEKGDGASRSLWSAEGVWEQAKLQEWLE